MVLNNLPLKLKDRSSINKINKLYYKDTCNVCVTVYFTSSERLLFISAKTFKKRQVFVAHEFFP